MIIRKSELKLFALLLISIFPVITLGGFAMPVLYLFIPFTLFGFSGIIFGRIKMPHVVNVLILIFSLIIVEVFLSTLFGALYISRVLIPTDAIQYLARLMCIISFMLMLYRSELRAESFIKMFLVVLVLAMSVGILQWLPWKGQAFFINLYPFRDGIEQLAQMDRELSTLRVHGVAQMATANGGIATFAFIFAFSVFSYFKKYKLLSVILLVFALVNIVASQARAGVLALAFSLLVFFFIKMYTSRRFFKPTLYFLMLMSVVCMVGYGLYNSGNPYITQIVYRFTILLDTNGGSRIDQISYGLSLLSEPYQYFWGISRAVQSSSDLYFHLEVEPVNIIVLYGIFGFILQYLLVFYLLRYFFKNIRKSINNPEIATLLIASFVGLASYQVFSLGYFFFREARIGLIPWILMGVTIGLLERQKRAKLKHHLALHNIKRHAI